MYHKVCQERNPRTSLHSGTGKLHPELRVPRKQSLSSSLLCLLHQVTTRWWSVDSSLLLTYMCRSYGLRSHETTTKSIIELWPKVLLYHEQIWASLCLNTSPASPVTHYSSSDWGGRPSLSHPSRCPSHRQHKTLSMTHWASCFIWTWGLRVCTAETDEQADMQILNHGTKKKHI